jgi:tRNA(Ile2) C34 agmatinyltransferase TiaS
MTCPHCHKEFTAKPIGSEGHRGFKCPHCRLFVPEDRAAEPEPAKT